MSMPPLVRAVVALSALSLSVAAVRAEDLPHPLAGDVVRTEHLCPTSTGYGTRFVTQRDVDGDGRRDVVLDYSDAWCGGRREPYCDASGCLLVVYLGRGHGWAKAFEARVRSWSVEERGGRPRLIVDGRPFGG